MSTVWQWAVKCFATAAAAATEVPWPFASVAVALPARLDVSMSVGVRLPIATGALTRDTALVAAAETAVTAYPAETATRVACLQHTQTAVTATPSRDRHTRGMPTTQPDSCDSHSQLRQPHTWHAYSTARQLWQPLPAETGTQVACLQHTQIAVTATPSWDSHTRGMPTTHTDSCDSHSQPRQAHTWHAYNTLRQLWQPLPAETATHVACLQHTQTAVTATPSRDRHTRGMPTTQPDSCDSHSQPRQPHTWHAYNTHRQLWQPLPAETATHVACLQHTQTAVTATPSWDSHTRGMPTTHSDSCDSHSSWDSHTRGMPTAQPDSCDSHSQLRQPHTWHAYSTAR